MAVCLLTFLPLDAILELGAVASIKSAVFFVAFLGVKRGAFASPDKDAAIFLSLNCVDSSIIKYYIKIKGDSWP